MNINNNNKTNINFVNSFKANNQIINKVYSLTPYDSFLPGNFLNEKYNNENDVFHLNKFSTQKDFFLNVKRNNSSSHQEKINILDGKSKTLIKNNDIERKNEEIKRYKQDFHEKVKEIHAIKIAFLKLDHENKKNIKIIQEFIIETAKAKINEEIFSFPPEDYYKELKKALDFGKTSDRLLIKLIESHSINNLKRQIFEYKQKIAKQEEENSRLKVNTRYSKYHDIEHKLNITIEEMESIKEDYMNLKILFIEKESQLKSSFEEKDYQKKIYNNLKFKYDEIKNKILNYEKSNNEYSDKNKKLEEINSNNRYQNLSFLKQLKERDCEIVNLKANIKDLENFKSEKDIHQKNLLAITNNFHVIKEELERKNMILKGLQKQITEFKTNKKIINNGNSNLQIEENTDLTWKKMPIAWKIVIKEKDKKIIILEKEINKLQNEIEKVNRDLHNVKSFGNTSKLKINCLPVTNSSTNNFMKTMNKEKLFISNPEATNSIIEKSKVTLLNHKMKKNINFNNLNKEQISQYSVHENSDIDINSKNEIEILKKDKINCDEYSKKEENNEEFENYVPRKEFVNAQENLLANNVNDDKIYRSDDIDILENQVDQQVELKMLELSGSEKDENERELEMINKYEADDKIQNLNKDFNHNFLKNNLVSDIDSNQEQFININRKYKKAFEENEDYDTNYNNFYYPADMGNHKLPNNVEFNFNKSNEKKKKKKKLKKKFKKQEQEITDEILTGNKLSFQTGDLNFKPSKDTIVKIDLNTLKKKEFKEFEEPENDDNELKNKKEEEDCFQNIEEHKKISIQLQNSNISSKKKKFSENNNKNYELISNGNNSNFTSDKDENHQYIDKDFINYRFDLNKKDNLEVEYENKDKKSENLTEKYIINNKRSASKNKQIDVINFQSVKQTLRNENNDTESNKNSNKIMILEEKEKLNLTMSNKSFENEKELNEDKRNFDLKPENLNDTSIRDVRNNDVEYENEEFYQNYQENQEIKLSENTKQNNNAIEIKNIKEEDDDIIYNNNEFGNYENNDNSNEK